MSEAMREKHTQDAQVLEAILECCELAAGWLEQDACDLRTIVSHALEEQVGGRTLAIEEVVQDVAPLLDSLTGALGVIRSAVG